MFSKDLDEEAIYELKKEAEAVFLPGLYDCVLFRIFVSHSDCFLCLELIPENQPTAVVANPSISLLPRASNRILRQTRKTHCIIVAYIEISDPSAHAPTLQTPLWR